MPIYKGYVQHIVYGETDTFEAENEEEARELVESENVEIYSTHDGDIELIDLEEIEGTEERDDGRNQGQN